MTKVQLLPECAETYIYNCPHEGKNCIGKKHCHVHETPVELKGKMTVVVQCPVRHKAKILVEIGT